MFLCSNFVINLVTNFSELTESFNIWRFVWKVGATSLVAISQQIGPELTTLYVMPKLKELFEKLAFSEETRSGPSLNVSKNKVENEQTGNRMDLVYLLSPSLL